MISQCVFSPSGEDEASCGCALRARSLSFSGVAGYTTGALTPVGCKTASLPIVLADPIAKLQASSPSSLPRPILACAQLSARRSDDYFVTPVCLPAQPDFFWMGGGEVDLKMGLRAADFVRIYKPHVADVTAADQQASGAAMGLE